MVEYEVTMKIQEEIFLEYEKWLKEHVDEMLKVEGFTSAKYYTVNIRNEKIFCVRYYVESRELLEKYISENSNEMRGNYRNQFEDKFEISRRILKEGDI